MAAIQRHSIERGKRNAISRRYHAKDDKEAIATCRLDLKRILHISNVCFLTSLWPLLTRRVQTELRMNTHATVPDIHQDAANKHTIASDVHHDIPSTETTVSDVRHDVSNTHLIVSGIRSNRLKSCDSQNQAVSATYNLTPTE